MKLNIATEGHSPGKIFKLLFPVIAIIASILLHNALPNVYPEDYIDRGFYIIFLEICLGVYLLALILSFFISRIRTKMLRWSWFLVAVFVVLLILNIGSVKTGYFTLPFIPGPDRVFASLVDNWHILSGQFLNSITTLAEGLFYGILAGLIYGTLMGWFKIGYYWLFPIIRLLGPVPGSIWMVLAVTLMPTNHAAGMLIIAHSVWFPLAYNLSGALRTLDASTVERARVLGANNKRIFFHVALPSSIPAIFTGLFMGVCFSFAALITAEMLAVKEGTGLGFYMNFLANMAAFDELYICMALVVVMIYIVLEILFFVQKRVLKWQEGVIRW